MRLQRTIAPYPYRPPDEEAYVDFVASLVKQREEIRTQARQMRVEIEANEQSYEARVSALNGRIDRLKHAPRDIPVTRNIASADCRALAEFDQSPIGEKIDELFPPLHSVCRHFEAASRGYQTYGTAMRRPVERLTSGLARRLARCMGNENPSQAV